MALTENRIIDQKRRPAFTAHADGIYFDTFLFGDGGGGAGFELAAVAAAIGEQNNDVGAAFNIFQAFQGDAQRITDGGGSAGGTDL